MNNRGEPESRRNTGDVPESGEEAIRILVADDYPLFRSRLVSFLRDRKEFVVVGEAETGWDVLETITTVSVDVITLDIRMPGPRVDEVIRKVRSSKPDVGIVVLTMHEDETYFHSALEAGAQGYILKKSSGNTLVRAIQAIDRKSGFVDPSIVKRLRRSALPSTGTGPQSRARLLTARETEVLRHIALGYSNEDIARMLRVRAHTIQKHRTRIMETLSVNTREEIVHFAIKQGLLHLNRS